MFHDDVDDIEIRHRINDLVDEEHRLEREHPGRALTGTERARLHRVSVELDQCWDLLRQRDARRRAGQNPEEARSRPPNVVENYRQ